MPPKRKKRSVFPVNNVGYDNRELRFWISPICKKCINKQIMTRSLLAEAHASAMHARTADGAAQVVADC